MKIHITMEATGVYYKNLAYYFQGKADYVVHVELPTKSAYYFKSLNIKSKTDEIDEGILGRLALERRLEHWNAASLQMRQIKKLCRERLRLLTEKTMVCNQLHAEQSSYGANQSSLERYELRIEFIKQKVRQIEKELKT